MNNGLLIKHEALRAQLNIRDFFLHHTVREVYENIGQALSFVRMQLPGQSIQNAAHPQQMDRLGEVVAQTIKDLRVMCNDLYPDVALVKETGFIEMLNRLVAILFPHTGSPVHYEEAPHRLPAHLRLILFNIIQEILIMIKEQEKAFVQLTVSFDTSRLQVVFLHTGKALTFGKATTLQQPGDALTLQQRIKLIRGKLKTIKNTGGPHRLELRILQKYFPHE
jgi:signal transduction histidine kinase